MLRFDTPLEVLRRHGYRHYDLSFCPPNFSDNPHHGYWTAKLKTLREMGIDMDEPSGDWMASNVGPIPVDGGDYLKFLIAVRAAVESDGPVHERIGRLMSELLRPTWAAIVAHHGHYPGAVTGYFFPTFLATVPSLPHHTALAMWDVALDTPARIDKASDDQLLAFKGIGPAVLRRLRARCAEITESRDEPLIDMVSRQ